MQNFIITGAPGTGKTSIINLLKEKGYNCYEEKSREIIINQIKNNGNDLPWKNLIGFSERVFKLREKQLLKSDGKLNFFDRGLIDVYAYMKVDDLKIPTHMTQSIKKKKYNKNIFLTPIWEEIYKNDNERKETLNQANMIEKEIIKSYLKFNYKIIKIPKISVEERIDFILSKI